MEGKKFNRREFFKKSAKTVFGATTLGVVLSNCSTMVEKRRRMFDDPANVISKKKLPDKKPLNNEKVLSDLAEKQKRVEDYPQNNLTLLQT